MIGIHQHRKMWNTWNAVEWFLTFSKCHEIPRQEPTLIHFLFLPLKCKTASRKMNLLTANKSYNIKPARPFLHLQKETRAHGKNDKYWTILYCILKSKRKDTNQSTRHDKGRHKCFLEVIEQARFLILGHCTVTVVWIILNYSTHCHER